MKIVFELDEEITEKELREALDFAVNAQKEPGMRLLLGRSISLNVTDDVEIIPDDQIRTRI